MLIPDSSFRSLIIQELEKGDKSISHLHRCLLDNGHKVHRLVLTGYLKAMEEMGVLGSREIPPSRVYYVSPTAEADLYGSVGNICRHVLEIPRERQPTAAMYFFQRLFRRPVFLYEMKRAGFDGDPGKYASMASNEERMEAKKLLARRGFRLPNRDPAYLVIGQDCDEEFGEILQLLVLRRFRASPLAMGTKQAKLM